MFVACKIVLIDNAFQTGSYKGMEDIEQDYLRFLPFFADCSKADQRHVVKNELPSSLFLTELFWVILHHSRHCQCQHWELIVYGLKTGLTGSEGSVKLVCF